jgi:hypothetical protein
MAGRQFTRANNLPVLANVSFFWNFFLSILHKLLWFATWAQHFLCLSTIKSYKYFYVYGRVILLRCYIGVPEMLNELSYAQTLDVLGFFLLQTATQFFTFLWTQMVLFYCFFCYMRMLECCKSFYGFTENVTKQCRIFWNAIYTEKSYIQDIFSIDGILQAVFA